MKIILNYPKSATMGICSWGFNNEFEAATVNEPSVFEPLKFYCTCIQFLNVSMDLLKVVGKDAVKSTPS